MQQVGAPIFNRVAAMLATDVTTLAHATTPAEVCLTTVPFTPQLNMSPAMFTQPTFPGYAPLPSGVGPQQLFGDASTGNLIVQLLEPAGGWHWAVTGTVTTPETIYGYFITSPDGTAIWGAQLFAVPVIINGGGQAVDVDQVRFTFLPTGIV